MEEYSLKYIKSKYILKLITEHLTKNKLFKIINYNKLIQNQLDIGIFDYKNNYEQIEIELIPINIDDKNYFINDEYKSYYHIYFNNDKNEKKQNYFNKNDNVTKINIILNNKIQSFEALFSQCKCIEKIKFIKSKRTNISNVRGMFWGCSSLKELNLNNFNIINVTNMRWIFGGCSSLNELNLNNFNINNVIDMYGMFSKCSDELKLKIKSKFKIFKEEAFEDFPF